MDVKKISGGMARLRIEVDGDDAYAYDGARQVGEVQTNGQDDLGHGFIVPPTITYMHVEQDYRRNGVCLTLIRELVEEFGQLLPAKRDNGKGGQNALTSDGERLTRRAQKEGLVAAFPDERLDDDDDD